GSVARYLTAQLVHAPAVLEQLVPGLGTAARIDARAGKERLVVEEGPRAGEPGKPEDAALHLAHGPEPVRAAHRGSRIGPVGQSALIGERREPGGAQLDQVRDPAARHGGRDLLLPGLPGELLHYHVEIRILGFEACHERLDGLHRPELPEDDLTLATGPLPAARRQDQQ